VLRWSLHELPSSQHRAGLAGLALCINFLQRRTDRRGVCEVRSIDHEALEIAVNQLGMQELFDDVYAASEEETLVKVKWPKREPKRIDTIDVTDEKSGTTRTENRFVYDKVVPAGSLIADQDKGAVNGTKYWLKLWQGLVWSTLRGVPATRKPDIDRAKKLTVGDGAAAWCELAESPDTAIDLPSTYAIGAQAQSAENAPIRDRVRNRFLLHFWPFCVAIYVPTVLTRELKREFVGYALAMPDVAVLDTFVRDWQAVARGRGGEPDGYVPRDAVVAVAGEAGLDVVRRTEEIVALAQGKAETRFSLTAVDVFHVEKKAKTCDCTASIACCPCAG